MELQHNLQPLKAITKEIFISFDSVQDIEMIRAAENMPDLASNRTFKSSRFLRLYDFHKTVPNSRQFLESIRNVIAWYAQKNCSDSKIISNFLEKIFSLIDFDLVLKNVDEAGVHLWTSSATLGDVKLKAGGVSFCSMLNTAIRSDDPSIIPWAVFLSRAINYFCCKSRIDLDIVESRHDWPVILYRGGKLPSEHHHFFQPGKKFRTPSYVATSKESKVAKSFALRVPSDSVLWYFHLIPKEQRIQFPAVCKQLNYIPAHMSKAGVKEEEFLFPPYSVFEVLSAEFFTGSPDQMSDAPLGPIPECFHKIHLLVAYDNLLEDLHLPLAPWS